MAATFDLTDDTVVVIIGSGAGGGTLANELAQRGIKVVILEAGPRHEIEDFVNDEWESFGQLAWKDMRTTASPGGCSGTSQSGGLDVKAVGGSTVHWAGAFAPFPGARVQDPYRIRSHPGRQPHGLADHTQGSRALLRQGRGQNERYSHRTASQGCRATTTSRSWPPAQPRSATSRSTLAAWQSTPSRATVAALANRSVSVFRAASRAPNGRRFTPRFRKGGDGKLQGAPRKPRRPDRA